MLAGLRRLASRDGEQVSESEVLELKSTVTQLHKQLHQIIDDEIPANNEACGVATNGMVMLRNELDEKRIQRDGLRGGLEEAKGGLARIQNQCTKEKEKRETCREDVARMQKDTNEARKEAINLRAEMEQRQYFQKVVDNETMHRVRADLQNLETEKERDEIRLRNLTKERDGLQTELDRLKALRDAHQIVATEEQRKVSEAEMTHEMYKAHHEALTEHLEKLGSNLNTLDFISAGFHGLFKSSSRKIKSEEVLDEKSATGSSLSCRGGVQQEEKELEQPKQTGNKTKPERIPIQTPQGVGGIVLGGATAGDGSSDFLRKLPTIFKMGGGGGNEGGGQVNIAREDREVEFSTDTSSHISSMTDDAEWKEGLTLSDED